MVAESTDLISLQVSQLKFNMFVRPALFIQMGGGDVTYAELLKGAERSSRKPDVPKRLIELTRPIPARYAASTSLCEHYAAQVNRLQNERHP